VWGRGKRFGVKKHTGKMVKPEWTANCVGCLQSVISLTCDYAKSSREELGRDGRSGRKTGDLDTWKSKGKTGGRKKERNPADAMGGVVLDYNKWRGA